MHHTFLEIPRFIILICVLVYSVPPVIGLRHRISKALSFTDSRTKLSPQIHIVATYNPSLSSYHA